MSRIRIVHTTTYRYANPVAFGIHRLVLRPREGHDVQVENLSLRICPSGAVSWHRDIFGNSIALATFSEPSDLLEFSSDATVFRRDHHSHRRLLDVLPVRLPVQYSSLEGPIAQGYSNRYTPKRPLACVTGPCKRFRRSKVTTQCISLMRSIAGSIIQSAIGAARTVACRPRWKLSNSNRVPAGTWPYCF